MIVRSSSILLLCIFIYNLFSNPTIQNVLNTVISYETGINESTITSFENYIKPMIGAFTADDMYAIINERNINITNDTFIEAYSIIRKVESCQEQQLIISIVNNTLGIFHPTAISNDIINCINN